MDRKSRTKVKVIIRVRPTLNSEDLTCVYPSKSKNNVEIFNHRNIKENLQYEFSTVYDQSATQKEIFDESVEPLLGNSFEGQNVSIFAYGPTGAGKTHTMLGSPSNPGITPRVIKWLFDKCGKEPQLMEVNMPQTTIAVSYLEIYNEKVIDLLADNSNDLPIREDVKHRIFVAGLTEKVVDSFESFKSIFGPACNKRSVAATNLNEHSSRSHSIVLLKVTRKFKDKEFVGKIHLIDLAGSEDNRRTGNKGMRLKESGAINKSLFVLGEVVDAINKNGARIPYRNSKLTRLLQDSLGGSCHSLMVTNIAPEEHYYYDTYCTLNFASKSKKITNICTTTVNSLAPPPLLKRSAASDSHIALSKKIKKETPPPTLHSSTSSSSIVPSPWKSSVNEKLMELQRQISECRESKVEAEISDRNSRLSSEDSSPDVVYATPIINKRKNALTDKSNFLFRNLLGHHHKHQGHDRLKRILDSGPSCSPLFQDSPSTKKDVRRRKSSDGETPSGKARNSVAMQKSKLDQCWQEKRNEDFLVTLNSANAKDLQKLHTVGAKRAKLIFEWRELHGSFHKLDALKEIPGFTCKYYEKFLKNNLITE